MSHIASVKPKELLRPCINACVSQPRRYYVYSRTRPFLKIGNVVYSEQVKNLFINSEKGGTIKNDDH